MAISVKIDDDLKARLGRLAESRNRSRHWLMCKAIEQYVTHEEQQESFKQEAYAAWRDYQETGQHVTREELETWLRSWGDDNEASAPQCHE